MSAHINDILLVKTLQEVIEIFEQAGEELIKELKPKDGYKVFDLFEKRFEDYIKIYEDCAIMYIDMFRFCFISYGDKGWGTGPIYSLTDKDGHEISLKELYNMVEGLKDMLVEGVINLTPQDIYVYDQEGNKTIGYYPTQGESRVVSVTTFVRETEKSIGTIDSIPVVATSYLVAKNLPEPQPGIYYIVSLDVLQQLSGQRKDLVAPNTGSTAVRDTKGRVKGIRSFITIDEHIYNN